MIAKANVVARVMGEESRESFGSDLVPCRCVNVTGGNSWAYGVEGGLLRVSDNRENARHFSLRVSNCGGAGEVAPITIDASSQFDQNQVAIL